VSKNSNDPAFPVCYQHKGEDGELESTCEHWGITMRDWFAGQALVGLLAAYGPHAIIDQKGLAISPTVAPCAFAIADAMLSAREKGTL